MQRFNHNFGNLLTLPEEDCQKVVIETLLAKEPAVVQDLSQLYNTLHRAVTIILIIGLWIEQSNCACLYAHI